MRKRNNASFGSIGNSDEESGSEPEPAEPQEMFASQSINNKLRDEISHLQCGINCYNILERLKEGKAWWVQCLTIYAAAFLTYSYNNVGNNSTNVQIAIMTVITLVGATTPLSFASSHLIPAAIGAFVGGQNIIGSTGPMEDSHDVHAFNYLWLLLLSCTVGFAWCFVINNSRLKILDGYAGRLGTTTFLGMNLVMVTVYGPAGIVDWDRYYYGFVHIIHVGEEDSSLSLASAWKWTDEAEVAVGYVLSVLWLGVVAGGTRILHNNHVQRCKYDGSSSSTDKEPPKALNNVLIPVLWALLSMLVINATQYDHAPALYNGFAVGAYVAMASLQNISSIGKFASVSLLASLWGLTLTPFFVGFAGKSGFTSMLGHVTHNALEAIHHRFQMLRRRRQEELNRQLQQLQVQLQEQRQAMQPLSMKDHDLQQHQQQGAPPSSPHHAHHHKPKKETFYTKQQRRQQQRLKHIHKKEEEKSQDDEQQQQLGVQSPPKLHHRAWSALPVVNGNGVWQHSLESSQRQQEFNSVV